LFDIPEPKFDPNKIIDEEIKQKEKATDDFFNPPADTQQIPKSAKEISPEDLDNILEDASSEELAEMIVDAYVTIKSDVIYLAFDINEDKLMKRSLKGKFNMNFMYVKIPLEQGNSITYKEYIAQYNNDLKEALSTPKTTQKKLRELLAKVLEKRGMKITPEQSLIYHISKDVLMTTGKLIQISSINKSILKYVNETYTSQKNEIDRLKKANKDLIEEKEAEKQKMRDKAKGKKQTKQTAKIEDAEIADPDIIVNEIEEPEERI
jgi:hypothetical protein